MLPADAPLFFCGEIFGVVIGSENIADWINLHQLLIYSHVTCLASARESCFVSYSNLASILPSDAVAYCNFFFFFFFCGELFGRLMGTLMIKLTFTNYWSYSIMGGWCRPKGRGENFHTWLPNLKICIELSSSKLSLLLCSIYRNCFSIILLYVCITALFLLRIMYRIMVDTTFGLRIRGKEVFEGKASLWIYVVHVLVWFVLFFPVCMYTYYCLTSEVKHNWTLLLLDQPRDKGLQIRPYIHTYIHTYMYTLRYVRAVYMYIPSVQHLKWVLSLPNRSMWVFWWLEKAPWLLC